MFLIFVLNDIYDLRSAVREMPQYARPPLPAALLHFFPSIDAMHETLMETPTPQHRNTIAAQLSSERDAWRFRFGSGLELDTGGQATGDDDAELGLIQDLLTACCTAASAAEAKGVAHVVAEWLGRGIDQELECEQCGHKMVFNLAAHPMSTTPTGISVFFDKHDGKKLTEVRSLSSCQRLLHQ